MAIMIPEHRKAVVRRVAAELETRVPSEAAIKEAFLRLQQVTVPDGFRITSRQWSEIKASVVRGVRISIGHKHGAKERAAKTGTPKVAEAPLKNVDEPKPNPLPSFTKIDRMEEAIGRLTEEMAGIKRVMLRIAVALEAQTSKGEPDTEGKHDPDFEDDAVNGNVADHPLQNPVTHPAPHPTFGCRVTVEQPSGARQRYPTIGQTAMAAAFTRAKEERELQLKYGQKQEDNL